ncbi:MAG: methionine gamma-lyase family protein [Bacilli bacterium]
MLNINNKVIKLVDEAEEIVKEEFKKIDEICDYNSLKVINAFHNNKVSDSHFNSTTGYGYDDLGRDCTERVFRDVLKAEDAIVRGQFISGTHALTVTLFAILRPNDTLLSICGKPYDTLDEVIGIKENESSLKSFGIKYKQVDLINDDFNYEQIKKIITTEKIKVIEIQRSKGYSNRKSITLDKIEKVIKEIKHIDKDIIVMIDNCYCEFVTKQEPLQFGADLIVGSLIKNLGGGIAPNGAYVAGKKELIKLVAERLTVPGEGKEVGPSLGMNKLILQGLFMAPAVVASSLKTAVLASKVLEILGYEVEPRFNDLRADIVQTITFKNKQKLMNFCRGIQEASAVDSFASPEAVAMPGYSDEIIMASGSFTQGSSIELSCDGPIKEPYVLYLQGGLTYNYGKIGVINAVSKLLYTDD